MRIYYYIYGWYQIPYLSKDYYIKTGLEKILSNIHKSIFGIRFITLPYELGGKFEEDKNDK